MFRNVCSMNICSMFVLLSLLSLVGCGGDDGRSRLSGKATFDGQPIVYGEIVFHPQSGPEGSATIRNGLFDTANEGGQGIARGPNRIVITGYAVEPVSTGDETVPTDATPPLFSSYELDADLTGDTVNIEVPAEAATSASKPVGRK